MTTTLQQLQDNLDQISTEAHPSTEIYFDGQPREVDVRFLCGRVILDIDGEVSSDKLTALQKKLDKAEAEACDADEDADNWESKYSDCERGIQRIVEASEANDPAKLAAAIKAASNLIQ